MAVTTDGKLEAKLLLLMNSRGRLVTIGGVKFEAKRFWQDPYIAARLVLKHQKTSTGDLSRLWAKGPANYHYYYYYYYYAQF